MQLKSASVFLFACIFCSAILAMQGCSSFQARYTDPDKVEIIDDKWNETDARLTAETMVDSMLDSRWLNSFMNSHGGKNPVLIVSTVRNRTDEVIDVKYLTDEIRTALIKSQKVRFVTKEGRDDIFDELRYQAGGAVKESEITQLGRQTGANYLLRGSIQSHVHGRANIKTVTYKTELELVSLESAELVWVENHKVKKTFKQSRSKW